MKPSRASLCVLLFSGFRRLGSVGACVELQGIESDGGDGLLDLNHLLSPEESLGKPLGPFDFTVSIIPTVSVITFFSLDSTPLSSGCHRSVTHIAVSLLSFDARRTQIRLLKRYNPQDGTYKINVSRTFF